jgi:hypothetical protein
MARAKNYLDVSDEFWNMCSKIKNVNEFVPKDELGALHNCEVTRTTATKLVWAYIKQNDLQDPDNKRNIICDTVLKELSDKPKISMFEVASVLNNNLFAKN